MKVVHKVLAGVAIAAAVAGASAQFVKGNEAVTVLLGGGRRVETPPLPATGPLRSTKPCLATDKCNGGAWVMVETNDGLVECTEAYARPGACRRSTFGDTKLLRVWLLKLNGQWQQCQFPDASSKCVALFARPPSNLPFPAVQ